jgi:quinolinate synthase
MVQSINATTPLEEARAALASAYDLTFTKAVARVTGHVYDRVSHRIPQEEWARLAPLIVHINRLKREKKAQILAHVQQSPAIYFGVADAVGDNLDLLRDGPRLREAVLIFAGVHTMAETLKLLAPKRKILIPDSRARCSLATSIAPDDVLAIRSQYPGVKVVVHVNSSLAVKALADATFTSANALKIVEAMSGDRVIMLPDQFLAQNVARQTSKKLITWAGSCEIHQTFAPDAIDGLREKHPSAKILAHPQTAPAVAAAADFVGASHAMSDWLRAQKPAEAIVLSEPAVADNLAASLPETKFLDAPMSSSYEQRINLENILWSLHMMTEEVTVAAALAPPALAAVERMLEISRKRD